MGSERKLEYYCNDVVKGLGGRAIKLSPNYNAGIPDRMIILPDVGGRVLFIEYKTKIGVLSSMQKHYGVMLNKLGYPYAVIKTKEEFNILINNFIKENNNDGNK